MTAIEPLTSENRPIPQGMATLAEPSANMGQNNPYRAALLPCEVSCRTIQRGQREGAAPMTATFTTTELDALQAALGATNHEAALAAFTTQVTNPVQAGTHRGRSVALVLNAVAVDFSRKGPFSAGRRAEVAAVTSVLFGAARARFTPEDRAFLARDPHSRDAWPHRGHLAVR